MTCVLRMKSAYSVRLFAEMISLSIFMAHATMIFFMCVVHSAITSAVVIHGNAKLQLTKEGNGADVTSDEL